jgi:hypothetical protein
MALPNLVFSVASEYDGKGLGKARKDVNSFDKTVKSLGRTLGATLSAAAVVSFGKASVKAFLADDKAAATLTRTLGNLNLAFEDQRVRSYISTLEASSGVLDSQLRPAMQALLTTTGSVTKSQELLGLAIDVAAGSGENLVTVSQDIAQAFVGNTRGLKKYNLGLTQAELQTATFADLQEKLNKQFSGQNAAQLDTYAGKLSLIKVAYDNLQETVGKGLVDSFAVLAGDTGIGSATKAIDDLGQAIADTVYGIALIVAEVKKLDAGLSGGVIGRLIAWSMKSSPYALLRGLSEQDRNTPRPFTTPMSISGQNTKNSLSAVEKMRAEAEAEALKRAKALAAAQKLQLANAKKLAAEATKKLALDKASAFLNQANKLFDLDRIQLAAAAMAKQSEEDKVRIRLKTNLLELEDAINEGNIQGAAKFAALITQDAALLGQLRDSAYNLSDVPNPFDAWLASLNAALAALIAMTKVIPIVTAMVGMGGFNVGSARMGESAGNTAAGLPANSLSDFLVFGDEHLGQLARQGGNATTINYNINAAGIGDQQIASVVQNAIQELNRYGNSTTYAGAI